MNLLMPVGSDKGREDLEKQRDRIRKINRAAAKKYLCHFQQISSNEKLQ
jgi:hypothetical protein